MAREPRLAKSNKFGCNPIGLMGAGGTVSGAGDGGIGLGLGGNASAGGGVLGWPARG